MNIIFDKVILIGSGKFPFQCAKYLKNYSEVSIYEYKASSISVLKDLCKKNDMQYFVFDKMHMTEALIKEAEYSERKILLISAFNTYILPHELLMLPNVTAINFHNAYLPLHPGRNAEAWSIYEGDRETGVTWHFIDTGIDSGDIIIQKKIIFDDKITSLQLLQKQTKLGYSLFCEMIEQLLQGKLQGQKQVVTDEIKMHFSKDVPNNGRLDLSWNLDKMYRFLRAMDYGKLCLLGIPTIEIDTIYYEIISYAMTDSYEETSEHEYVIREGSQVLVLKLRKLD